MANDINDLLDKADFDELTSEEALTVVGYYVAKILDIAVKMDGEYNKLRIRFENGENVSLNTLSWDLEDLVENGRHLYGTLENHPYLEHKSGII